MFADDLLPMKIALGEDSELECKAVRFSGNRVQAPDSRQIADELSALANSSSGGVLVFGVDDRTKRIAGIPFERIDALETWVRNICNDAVNPPLDCTIRKVPLTVNGESVVVLRVDVPSSLFVHKGPGGYYRRIGSSKRELTPENLARLFQQRSQTRIICFDEQIVAGAGVDVLSPLLYNRLKSPLSPFDDQEFLRKMRLVDMGADGAWHPTVAGVLTAAEHPEQFLPNAYIQAVSYRGVKRDANEQLDARDITGPLAVQIAEACAFVDKNMKVAAVKRPGRMDIPQYSLHSVFEAIVNAVAHRDYSIREAKIRLHLFSDRLELFSPGGLPNSIRLDEMKYRQFARNELICSVLSKLNVTDSLTEHLSTVLSEVGRIRFLDRRGEGVPIITEKSERLSNKPVEYRVLGDSELMLTIPAAPVHSPRELSAICQKLTQGIPLPDRNLTEEKTIKATILGMIRDNPQITQAELARRLGKSRTAIAYWIKRLPGVRRVGSDRSGYWAVSI